jgi:hypothetical protein
MADKSYMYVNNNLQRMHFFVYLFVGGCYLHSYEDAR